MVQPSPAPVSIAGFGDLLAVRVADRESQIVLGLDPDPMKLWPSRDVSGEGVSAHAQASPAERAATAVLEHCRALIDAAGSACVAIKPQLARFEQLGAAGWGALESVVEYAHEAGLLAIADGKRGDIDVTAMAYAGALQGTTDSPAGAVEGLGADMITVNPLMGSDAVAPFVETAREAGPRHGHPAGVLVLVRTSNPGAADIEDLELVGGGRVWERIATLVERLGADGVGESGLSDVGAVVGATVPKHLERARELMPRAVFLLPGVGAQGGRVEDLAAAFVPGRAGGLIAVSRSIANAHIAGSGAPSDAALAEAERLRELAWDISG